MREKTSKQPTPAPFASAEGPCPTEIQIVGRPGTRSLPSIIARGDRVVRWCWVNKLPVPGRPTILIAVGQGPTALTAGAGGGCLDIFTLIYPFSPLSPSLWETA